MRKLVTIRQIADVLPIEGADNIVLVKIDGWQCVALKNEFKVGDQCVYFEIDSFIPLMPQVEHLRARAERKMGDKVGIRIKTIKLRGQISQGLALPLNSFPQLYDYIPITGWNPMYYSEQELQKLYQQDREHLESIDFSDKLGVEKWEPPVPTQLAGQMKGNFPSFIQKTDQERCQNMGREIFVHNADSRYEVTMKLDGTSFTAFYRDGEDGVCGRNWQLDINEENATNSLVRMYVDSGLQAVLRKLAKNYAIQGELMGPGIQKNRESLKSHTLFVFDIYDIDNMCYLTPQDRMHLIYELEFNGLNGDMVMPIPRVVPGFDDEGATLTDLGITNMQELLLYAEGRSFNHPTREGLVFKRVDGEFSFKIISNKFLLKEED